MKKQLEDSGFEDAEERRKFEIAIESYCKYSCFLMVLGNAHERVLQLQPLF